MKRDDDTTISPLVEARGAGPELLLNRAKFGKNFREILTERIRPIRLVRSTAPPPFRLHPARSHATIRATHTTARSPMCGGRQGRGTDAQPPHGPKWPVAGRPIGGTETVGAW